jgi:cyclic pyranopterin phosphate synthase
MISFKFASVHSLKQLNSLTQIRQFAIFSANKKINSNSVITQFTHFNNETNEPKQVDISEKSHTNKIRIACASGYIQLNQVTFHALVENKLKKGNALLVAQIAGIQASKKTSSLIPLCHTILLDGSDVKFRLDEQNFRIYCETTCKTSVSKTGVEMEALTSNAIALLTIYDMCKALQKDASINEIQLVYKYGGKSDYKRN